MGVSVRLAQYEKERRENHQKRKHPALKLGRVEGIGGVELAFRDHCPINPVAQAERRVDDELEDDERHQRCDPVLEPLPGCVEQQEGHEDRSEAERRCDEQLCQHQQEYRERRQAQCHYEYDRAEPPQREIPPGTRPDRKGRVHPAVVQLVQRGIRVSA